MQFTQAPRDSAPLTQLIGGLVEVIGVDIREYDRTWSTASGSSPEACQWTPVLPE